MYVIVIGCGKVGSGLATLLSQEGHDVVIIDNDAKAMERLDPDFTGLRIVGVPIDQDVLKRAGIEQADALTAVTPDDNVNIMSCQIAKEIYKVKKVIARIYNPSREFVFHQFGLDTICPTNLSVEVIRAVLLGDQTLTQYIIGSNTITFAETAPDPSIVGKRVRDLRLEEHRFLFGINRRSEFLFARQDLIIEADDTLLVSTKVD